MTVQCYKEIIAFLRQLLKGSEWEGYVYAVGGCCRDMVMGVDINDIDLAVNLPDGGVALAEWLHEKEFTQAEPIFFRKYGTAKLTLKQFPDVELELVQTRAEKYTDRNSRNPATAFGSIADDCFRRDLTINSLYQNVETGEMLDITGRGIADIKEHIIRTPSAPDVTFDDDPVRILRAVRFAARYGWEIDPLALEAMAKHVQRLEIISPERLYTEFEKILTCARPSMALDALRRLGAMPLIMPVICPAFDIEQGQYHFGTVWQHCIAAVDRVSPDPVLRMAALLHDIGKIDAYTRDKDGNVRFPRHDKRCHRAVVQALGAFHCRRPFIDKVLFLCVNHEAAKSWGPEAEHMSDAALRRLQYRCGTPARFDALLELIDADNRTYAPAHCMPRQVEAIRRRAEELRTADGVSMFSYHLPLKPSRIARILHTGDAKVIERVRQRLLDMAFDNPRISREKMAAIVEAEAANVPASSAKGASLAKGASSASAKRTPKKTSKRPPWYRRRAKKKVKAEKE